MTAIFITATGTDIGKTFVTAGLIRHFRAAGARVHALKPVATGFDPASAFSSDPGELLAALGRPVNTREIESISPWRFAAPLSPDMAAQKESRAIDFDKLVGFCRQQIERSVGTLLIEGIGGVMVPLDSNRTVLDWMEALKIPVLLVTGSYLGTLSHTLTALDVLRRRDLALKALVVNATPGATVSLSDTVATLRRFAGAVPIAALPRNGAGHELSFSEIARLL
jgi:dethiobiotin synthetase